MPPLDPELLDTLRTVDTSPVALAQYQTMPLEQRRLVLLALHVRDGKTQLEIARAVGVHPSNVGRQLQRVGVLTMRQASPRARRRTKKLDPLPSPRERAAMERVEAELRPLPRNARRRVLRWAQTVLAASQSDDL